MPERDRRAGGAYHHRPLERHRPGSLAEVTTLATELDINIADLELAHSAEGDKGVMLLLVESAEAGRLAGALHQRGYTVVERPLEQP